MFHPFLHGQFSGTKYIPMVVCPSPPSISRAVCPSPPSVSRAVFLNKLPTKRQLPVRCTAASARWFNILLRGLLRYCNGCVAVRPHCRPPSPGAGCFSLRSPALSECRQRALACLCRRTFCRAHGRPRASLQDAHVCSRISSSQCSGRGCAPGAGVGDLPWSVLTTR